MMTNFKPLRRLGRPARIVTSEVMVAAKPKSALEMNGRPRSFLGAISRHMHQLDTVRQGNKRSRVTQSVLLVDDDQCNRELIEDIFRYDGIPAMLATASTAEEGLATVADLRPILILMDLNLPGMGGIEATRLLKKDPATEHIPIWAVTCLNHRKDIERALDAGCDGYVTKPIRRSEFVFRLLSLWDQPVCLKGNGLEPDDMLGSDYWIS